MKKLHGILRLTTPLHVSTWAEQYRLSDDGKIVSGNFGYPLVRTARETFHVNELEADTSGIYPRMEAPIFPSNDFRGRIRSQAADMITAVLKESGEKIPLDSYNGLYCGAISKKPDSNPPTTADIEATNQHLFMGLFGGGPRLHKSSFCTYDWRPILQGFLDMGALPEKVGDQPLDELVLKSKDKPVASLQPITRFVRQIRRDKVLLLEDPDAGEFIENYVDSVNEYQDNEAKSRSNKKSDNAEAVGAEISTGLRSMSAFEVVNAGVPFYWRIDIDDNVTDAQIGLLLSSVANLATKQGVGGLKSKGLGRFILTGYLNEDGVDTDLALSYNPEAQLCSPTAEMKKYIDAMESELENITGDDIARFFKNGVMAQ